MNIRSANRPLGFMNDKSGTNSSLDEMEVIRMRSQGGRADIPSFYEETGSLPVAKTLARHYSGGGRRRYQKGGELRKLTGPDDFYTQEEIDMMTDEQFDQAFPDQLGTNRSDEDLAAAARLGWYPDGKGGWTKRTPEDQARDQKILDIMGAAGEGKTNEERSRMLGSAGNQASTPGGVNAFGPSGAYVEEGSDGKEIIPEVEAVTPGAGTGGGSDWVDPRTPYTGPKVQGTGYDLGTYTPDLSQIDLQTLPGGTPPYTPDVGPGWWDENQRGIRRGLGNVGAGLLNIAPHLSNIRDYRDMPGVPAPMLQRGVNVEAPSMEATRQAILAQGRNASQRAEGMSTADQLAANATAMAGTQSALSRLGGQEAQTEAQYDAMNARSRQGIDASNIASINQARKEEVSRDLAKMRGIAGERGQIASKSLGFIGDLNRQQLDRDRMDLIRQRYNMQGQMDRAALKQFEETGILPEYYRS